MASVAFLGMGVMGYPMAGHLLRAGHQVTVYNRTASRATAWLAEHPEGRLAHSPREAAATAEVVFSCVGNDDDVRSVVLGDEGAFSGMTNGAILVDHTTASATVARELGVVADEHGFGFVDAPISGGQSGAENGALTVMCGGRPEHFATVEPVIGAYARAVTLLGPVGSGQLTKMVNQICIAGIVQGLAEGLEFGRRAGLDVDQVVDVISKGAAQSWQMDNRARTMVRDEYDFGFAVEWMRKDLRICLETAREIGTRLPVAALVDQFYAVVEARGGRRWDTSSLVQLLRHD
ncbi:MAG: NAD(P)-dependent oxidoreductase [Acidimicrobiia bacterium]|nr:NAD(P)-dependent oxidoreductase [Acidimicrobiia bacterium]